MSRSGTSASATSRSTSSRPGRELPARARPRRPRLARPRRALPRPILTDCSRSPTPASSSSTPAPQDWLGGDASARSVLYALRHDLTPVAAYALGRGLALGEAERQRLNYLILGIAAVVAAWGLVDIYTVSLQSWRDSGVPGWFREQLGLEYEGLSGLPENWVYNPGDERPLRRLVSTFLSPLATAYLLLVAILAASTRRDSRWPPVVTALLAAGLFFTFSRTAIAALAVGLVVLAYALRTWWPVAAAVVLVAAGFFFARGYEDIAPETRFTPAELEIQRAGGAEEPTSGDPTSLDEASVDSHLDNLRDGIETVLRRPVGLRARQRGRDREADGHGDQGRRVDLHRARGRGQAARHARLRRLERLAPARPRAPRSWLGASLAAVLGLAIQTDVIGVHWLAFVLYALAGERT